MPLIAKFKFRERLTKGRMRFKTRNDAGVIARKQKPSVANAAAKMYLRVTRPSNPSHGFDVPIQSTEWSNRS